MKLLIIAAIMLVTEAIAQKVSNAAIHRFVVDNAWYSLNVPEASLKQAVKWDLESPPPIAPNDAFRRADRICKESALFNSIPRKLKCISLQWALDDRWYYLITYSVAREGSSTGRPEEILIAVLFDGTVILGLLDTK
jgi:hypothetical protein